MLFFLCPSKIASNMECVVQGQQNLSGVLALCFVHVNKFACEIYRPRFEACSLVIRVEGVLGVWGT
jgi:hypothetical protein